MKTKKTKSNKELFFIFIIFSFILLLVNFSVEKIFFKSVSENLAIENGEAKLKEREQYFNDFLKDPIHELNFFKNLTLLKKYLNNPSSKDEIDEFFLYYMNTQPKFTQLSFIDKEGMEKIKINRKTKDATPYFVKNEHLKNISNNSIFKNIKTNPVSKVWFSELKLKNDIEPFTPILQAMLPINQDKEFKGVLTVTYFMDDFLDSFSNMALYDLVLCDKDGFPLIHYEKNKSWGRYATPVYNIIEEYSNQKKEILKGDLVLEKSFVSKRIDLPLKNQLFLILKLKEKSLVKQNYFLTYKYIFEATALGILCFLLTILIIKIFGNKFLNSKEISKLTSDLQTASSIAKIGFWEIDWKTGDTTWSDEVYNIFEIEDKSKIFTYDELSKYMSEKDREYVNGEFENAKKEKKEFFLIHQLITEKNNIKYVQARGTHYFKNDKLDRTIGSLHDVTQKYHSENKYKTLLDLASDGIHILDKKGNIIECSESFAHSLGYTKEEIKSLNIKDWDGLINPSILKENIKKFIKTPTTFETIHKRKDGSTFPVQVNAKGIILNGKDCLYASQRDISSQKILEEQLIKEMDFVSTIIDSANAVVAVINSDGRMIKVNKYAQNFTGYSQEEIASEPYFWARFLPESIQDKVKDIVKKANDGEIVNQFKNAWISKDGKERMFEWSNTLVRKNDGTMDYIATIGIDLTEKEEIQNQISNQKAKYEYLLSSATDGLHILDKKGNIVEASQSFAKMLGYTYEEILKLNIEDWDMNATTDPIKYLLTVAKREKIFNTRHRRKDGTYFPVQINPKIIEIDGKELIYASSRDITENLKLFEETMIAKNNAEKANRSKSDFLANMSHEIRTPLNGIIGLISLVLEMPLEELQKEYLKKAKYSSSALLNIINDILDYSKIEAGKLKVLYQEFDLENIIKNISNLFGYEAYEKGLDLSLLVQKDIPTNLIGDSLRLNQILNNLVGNAIKFTPDGYVALKIEIISTRKEVVKLRFCVEDSGIGISEKNQKKLFKSFEQLDSSNDRKYGGSGLGLVITEQLIQLLDGKLWFESEENVGSKFFFELDFKYIGEKNKEIKPTLKRRNKHLIIGDNILEKEYLLNTLNSWGIETYIAKSDEEAIKMLENEKFDSILIDWHKPMINDITLLKKLKEKNSSIEYIILINSYDKKSLIDTLLNQSIKIDKVLEKPFTPSSVFNTLFDSKDSHEVEKPEQSLVLSDEKLALLVEDNETNQIVEKAILEKIGFIVDIAKDGIESVEKVKLKKYDIIFMDLQMPNLDGFGATKMIRRFDKTTPIIALSAAVMQKDKALTKKVGMDAHISKPIIKDEFEQLISNYFEIKYIKNEDSKDKDGLEIYGIDFKNLMNALSFNLDQSISVVKKFYRNYKDVESQLETIKVESEEFEKYIHKLKGVSGNIQASEIYNLCIGIENTKILLFKTQLIVKLKIEMRKIFESIEKNILSKNGEKTLDNQKEVIIDNVINDLNQDNFISTSKVEQLLEVLRQNIDENSLKKIEIYFSNYDYDELIIYLSEIQKKITRK